MPRTKWRAGANLCPEPGSAKLGCMRRSSNKRDVALGLVVVCGRVGVTAGKVALVPLRVAARSPLVAPVLGLAGESLGDVGRTARFRGRDQLENAAVDVLASEKAERAVDRALAGPLPEAVARSLIERRVVQRIVEQALASAEVDAALEHGSAAGGSAGVERLVSDALDSRLVSDVTDQVIESAELQRLVEGIVSSPAVRSALTNQTASFGEEIAAGFRRRAERLDDSFGNKVHHWLGRKPSAETAEDAPAAYGGLATRATAFVIDLLISLVIFLVFAGIVALDFRPRRRLQAPLACGARGGDRLGNGRRRVPRRLLDGRGPDPRHAGARPARHDRHRRPSRRRPFARPPVRPVPRHRAAVRRLHPGADRQPPPRPPGLPGRNRHPLGSSGRRTGRRRVARIVVADSPVGV